MTENPINCLANLRGDRSSGATSQPVFQCVYQSLLISFHITFSPPLSLFYWSLHLFYYIFLFLQHWWAKSMHNAHPSPQKECKWKPGSLSMSHIYLGVQCRCVGECTPRTRCSAVPQTPISQHSSGNGASAKPWVPTTVNHNSYEWGLFYTGHAGLDLAGIHANRKDQLSREWSGARWRESSPEVGEHCISHRDTALNHLPPTNQKAKWNFPLWDRILGGKDQNMQNLLHEAACGGAGGEKR